MLYEDRKAKLQWAKNRAFELLEAGYSQTDVLSGFASDMQKMELLNDVTGKLIILYILRAKIYSIDDSEVKNFIDGFN